MYSPKRRFRLFRSSPWATTPGGSLVFTGGTTNALQYANEADFQMGSGDFTIEWFQYFQTGGSFPRVFSIGSYPSASIGVSIESGTFYLWRGNTSETSFAVSGITNTWVHFAIVGENNNTIKIYQDGVLKATYSGTYNFNDSTNALTIGNESTRTVGAGFSGGITNFRWTKGTAVYTSGFSKPTQPLTALPNTKLLLLAQQGAPFADSSGLGKTATNYSVVYNASSPFS